MPLQLGDGNCLESSPVRFGQGFCKVTQIDAVPVLLFCGHQQQQTQWAAAALVVLTNRVIVSSSQS